MDSPQLSHCRAETHNVCNLCNVYLDEEDVITHMTNKHCDSYFYKCHLCSYYEGYERKSLFQHQKDKHDVINFYLACPICMEFVSLKEESVIEHIIKDHSRIENVFVCNYCSYYDKVKLDGHFNKVHSRYVCVFLKCKAVCQNAMDLFQHYVGYHFPRLTLFYECPECDRMFSKETSLNQHKRDKHDLEDEEEEDTSLELLCPACSFATYNRKSYEQHSVNKHPGNFFNCTFHNCNYQTKLFRSLVQHTIDKHLSSMCLWYQCHECEEVSFKKVYDLFQHLRDKHYITDYCSLCETYEEDLSYHISTDQDHSYENFLCEICKFECEEKDELLDHISDNHVNITPLLWRLYHDSD